jgi:hypothetical protein
MRMLFICSAMLERLSLPWCLYEYVHRQVRSHARLSPFRFPKENQRRIHSGKTSNSTHEHVEPFSLVHSWVRAQELGAMVNCILLISLCFTILVQAIKRLIVIEPVNRDKLKFYIIVGAIGLLINILSLVILGSSSILTLDEHSILNRGLSLGLFQVIWVTVIHMVVVVDTVTAMVITRRRRKSTEESKRI